MKYRPRIHIPIAVMETRSLSPTRIREWILNRFNRAVTPESVTMWFKRHSKVREELHERLLEIEIPQEEISPTIFQNGAFEELDSVKGWLRDLRRRQLRRHTIRQCIATLKRICQGVFPDLGIDLKEHGWVLKHPDRLLLDDGILFMDLCLEHYPKLDIANHIRTIRSFLKSKGIAVEKIPSVASNGAGEMADLYVEKPILHKILQWIREQSYEAYVCDLFMFLTAARIGASLGAVLENITQEGEWTQIRVYEKGRGRKYPEGRPCDKYLCPDLFREICNLTGYPEKRRGRLFNLTRDDMSNLNREALEKFCPWVFEKHPGLLPNHFWRHMFFQHMLRETGWNYAAVAGLGHCSVKSLQDSYGKAPRGQVREWGLQHIPNLVG